MSDAQPSIQQLTFIEAYLRHGRATNAAREAGYERPDNAGWKLLRQPTVKAYLDEYRSIAAERHGINADLLMQNLAAIIGLNIDDLYHADGRLKLPSEMDEKTRMAVASIEEGQFGRKLKAYDKLSAITLAMKHLGLLVDRVEHSGEVSVVGMAQRIRERAAKAAPDSSAGFA